MVDSEHPKTTGQINYFFSAINQIVFEKVKKTS